MDISYKRLWHLLIDRDMKKRELLQLANISTATLSKLTRGENVNTDILVRICRALDCSLEDIMELLPEGRAESADGHAQKADADRH
ncbi:MAG: helix-turn-helix transcriptional regulator [Clostridiales Family XIII bacterium]|jgi:DNA-binding Xre family transcriptional regulator|nr:helix-turn-helix transcriptional regulator [Clostridiales Family XIII bacterium]